jgi:hypothetical protein
MGALVALAPLSGCGRERGKSSGGNTEANGSAAAGDPCADLTGVTIEERSLREESGYVADTPDSSKRCDNCEYWERPKAGAPCGGCSVISGPIHARGYCDLWEEKS